MLFRRSRAETIVVPKLSTDYKMNPNRHKRLSLSTYGKLLLSSFGASSLGLYSRTASAQLESSVGGKAAVISQIGNTFLEKTGIPALSIAFAKHGQIVHQEAFGFANLDRKEKLNVAHTFRIASVSKPITASVVFALIEAGKLKQTDLVFGGQGILRRYAPDSEATKSLTINHLLTHSSGGWGNRTNDPMFMHTEASHAELIAWVLKNLPLIAMPGTSYEYSNFGYCLLGRIIEQVTGKTYEQAAKDLILNRAGISQMQIAGNRANQKLPNEVVYYADRGENPYAMNISRMDSHGGWLATPTELVKFVSSVDGLRPSSNILKTSNIAAMTRPSSRNSTYASGWQVNGAPNWWHNGSLPGTSSLVVRTASGMCWSACANARTKDSLGLLDDMMWSMARSVPAWQA
jgi:CubicO group peptidase (beta-lactamase class C family)